MRCSVFEAWGKGIYVDKGLDDLKIYVICMLVYQNGPRMQLWMPRRLVTLDFSISVNTLAARFSVSPRRPSYKHISQYSPRLTIPATPPHPSKYPLPPPFSKTRSTSPESRTSPYSPPPSQRYTRARSKVVFVFTNIMYMYIRGQEQ